MKNRRASPRRVFAERLCGVVLTLAAWQLAAVLLNSTVLLATPLSVLRELASLVFESSFWLTVWFSFRRIVLGFAIALASGMILAAAAARFRVIESLLWPIMSVIKATPVASFIILCLIWLNSQNLSVFISFLMVLPIVYTNVLQGLVETDEKMLEMAKVFRLGGAKKTLYIYLPQIKPYLLSACSLSLGIAWKSGVAAEVIGIPTGSIGERLYQAKVYLNSPELFAWTVVVIVVSIAFEKLFMLLLRSAYSRLEAL